MTGRGRRWTAAELESIQRKQRPAADRKSAPITAPRLDGSKPKPRIRRRDAAIQSISEARITASITASGEFVTSLQGASLLAINAFLGLVHFERIPYKHACHAAMRLAFSTASGDRNRFQTMTRYKIDCEIVTPKLMDFDTIHFACKYLIDGLRHAGVVIDDGPKNFLGYADTRQTKGAPEVKLRVFPV